MKDPLRSQNGFTVVELMVAVLIAGAVTAVITGYLLAHIRSYEAAKAIVDIQYEGQLALNQMSRIAMESTGVTHIVTIDEVTGAEIDNMDKKTIITLNDDGEYIAFRELEEDGSELYHIYTVRNNNIINYSQSEHNDLSDPTTESLFARHVVALSVTPGKSNRDSSLISDNEDFQEAYSIDLELDLESGDATLNLKTQAKYRNK